MMTLVMILALQAPMLGSTASWIRLPVMSVVPDQQRFLQMEAGIPIKSVKRSRAELIKLAITTRN